MQAIMTDLLTPKDFLIMGFFGFWGLVGLSIIGTVLYLWRKDRHTGAEPGLRLRRRRRV